MNSTSGLTDPKRVVERGYDQVAHEYTRLEGEPEWPRMRWLRKLLNWLEPGSSVLDLGCGSGEPADVEISKEHQVTGVDISQTQINLARQNVPTGHFVHGDAGSAEFPPSSFDAVVSFYTLEHIPREEHKAVLRRTVIGRWDARRKRKRPLPPPCGMILTMLKLTPCGRPFTTPHNYPFYQRAIRLNSIAENRKGS